MNMYYVKYIDKFAMYATILFDIIGAKGDIPDGIQPHEAWDHANWYYSASGYEISSVRPNGMGNVMDKIMNNKKFKTIDPLYSNFVLSLVIMMSYI